MVTRGPQQENLFLITDSRVLPTTEPENTKYAADLQLQNGYDILSLGQVASKMMEYM